MHRPASSVHRFMGFQVVMLLGIGINSIDFMFFVRCIFVGGIGLIH